MPNSKFHIQLTSINLQCFNIEKNEPEERDFLNQSKDKAKDGLTVRLVSQT